MFSVGILQFFLLFNYNFFSIILISFEYCLYFNIGWLRISSSSPVIEWKARSVFKLAWDLQMVLHPSQSIAGAAIGQKAAAKPNYCLMDHLFRKEFNQPDPGRTWSMNVDKLQIECGAINLTFLLFLSSTC